MSSLVYRQQPDAARRPRGGCRRPRLGRLGALASAAMGACADASALAVPAAAGIVITAVLGNLTKRFTKASWFHGNLSAREADHILKERGRYGSFLVRESQSKPGDYVLTVRLEDRTSHVMIRWKDNRYDIGGGEKFETIGDLIEYYKENPMVEISGDALYLRTPFNATRINASGIYSRIKELKKEKFPSTERERGFCDEFEALQMLECKYLFARIEGNRPENRMKNRYKNIVPFDHSRVLLRDIPPNAAVGAEYINANYIRPTFSWEDMTYVSDKPNESCPPKQPESGDEAGASNKNSSSSSDSDSDSLHSTGTIISPQDRITASNGSSTITGSSNSVSTLSDEETKSSATGKMFMKTYIATQGCLSSTVADFWSMMWQDDSRIIVMTTKIIERGKVKCSRYWPLVNETFIHDRFTVKGISETPSPHYVLTELLVTKDDENPRTVFHFHFLAWPDHGVPLDPGCVLNFLQDINRKQEKLMAEPDGPKEAVICVHCSAGIGRTGTFIVIDILIDQVRKNGLDSEIDIQKTIQLVRAQRNGMVQTEAQYKFVYMSVHHYIQTTIQRMREEQRCSKIGRAYTNIRYMGEIGSYNAESSAVLLREHPSLAGSKTSLDSQTATTINAVEVKEIDTEEVNPNFNCNTTNAVIPANLHMLTMQKTIIPTRQLYENVCIPGQSMRQTIPPPISSQCGPSSQPGCSFQSGLPSQPGPSSRPGSYSQPGPSSRPDLSSQPGPSSRPDLSSQPGPSSRPDLYSQPGPSSRTYLSSQPGPSSRPALYLQPIPSRHHGLSSQPSRTLQTTLAPRASAQHALRRRTFFQRIRGRPGGAI